MRIVSAVGCRREAIQTRLRRRLRRTKANTLAICSMHIRYCAGENAAPFLTAFQTPYLRGLKARADWLIRRFGAYTESELRAFMRKLFDGWIEEFQVAERSLGGRS